MLINCQTVVSLHALESHSLKYGTLFKSQPYDLLLQTLEYIFAHHQPQLVFQAKESTQINLGPLGHHTRKGLAKHFLNERHS